MSAITWDHEPALSRPVASRPALSRPAVSRPGVGRTSAGRPARARVEEQDGAHLRLTARGRVVVWAAALAVATGVGLSAQSAGADAPGTAMPVETHVVAPGETLWQIAGTVAEPGEDLRVVVDELVELNGLGGAGLQAGQQILVPVD